MPVKDFFSRKTDIFGGAFSADSARVTFPNVGGIAGQFTAQVGLLIQNLSMGYSQQVTRLYEVGTPAIYYVGGRTSGEGNISRIVGPRLITSTFYEKYGDVCQAATNSLQFAAATGCGATGSAQSLAGTAGNFANGNPNGIQGAAEFTAYFVVLTQIQLTVNAENVVIGENLAYMFSSLEYNSTDIGKIASELNNVTP
jgi:hypothetical protein